MPPTASLLKPKLVSIESGRSFESNSPDVNRLFLRWLKQYTYEPHAYRLKMILLTLVGRLKTCNPMTFLAIIALQVNHHLLPMYGKGKNDSREEVERLLNRLVEIGALRQMSKSCTLSSGFTVSKDI